MGLVVFTAVVTVLALVGATRLEDRTAAGGLGWLLAPALAGVLLVRRRFPLMALLASIGLLLGYYASGRPAVGLELLLAPAFFSAAERGRMRTSILIAAGLLMLSFGARISLGQDPVRLLTLDLPVALTVLAGAIGAGDAVHSRALRAVAAAERQRLLAAERTAEARSLVEAERRAVAREVHDVLGHSMVVIGTQADVALDGLEDTDQVRSSLEQIRGTARAGLADIRQSLHVLAPSAAEGRDPVATLAMVPALVDRMVAAGLTVELQESGTPSHPPVAISATGYRVVQEALTNVAKHAAAKAAVVVVRHDPDRIRIAVSDPGPAPADWAPGVGITGLRERVAMVGGALTAGPDAGGAGFRVEAVLPLRTEAL